MSAPMRTHRTKNQVEIVAGGRRYRVPKPTAKAVLTLIESYRVEHDDDESVPAAEVFRDLNSRPGGKRASLLRGLRGKHELTQIEMAEKLGCPQSHISAMESGTRPIGSKVIAKIAKAFRLDARLFK